MNKLKMWAVVWTEKGMEEYGVPKREAVISVEPREAIKVDIRKNKKIGRPAIRYTFPCAFFLSKREARACREGNKDWTIVQCTITYELPAPSQPTNN